MPKRVEVPGFGVVEFPDDMPDVRIEGIIRTQIASSKPTASRPAIDPTTGMGMPTTPEATEETFKGMAEGGLPPMRTGAAMAIGTALPVAGAAAGSAGGPAGTIAGEMAGSYGARKLNVALGLEEPGMVGDVASVVLPPALRGAGALIKGVAKRFPGVGTALQEEGVENARQMVEGLTPAPKSNMLYAKVEQLNPQLALRETPELAQRMLATESLQHGRMRQGSVRDAAEALSFNGSQAYRSKEGEVIDFRALRAIQQRIRDLMSKAEGDEFNRLGQLDAAIWRDMEGLATSAQTAEASALLRTANKTFRKEKAVESLRDIIEGSITPPQGQPDAIERLNAGAMLKKFDTKVRHDELFAGAFTGSEQQEIRSTLTELSKLPLPGPVSGAMYGAGIGLGTWSTGLALGLDPQVAAGITATTTILPHALATKTGRAVVRGLSKSGKLYTPEGIAALRGFVRTSGQLAAE